MRAFLKLISAIILPFIFSSCGTGYQKQNGSWVWVTIDESNGKREKYIETSDPKSFTVLDNEKFAVDEYAVFFEGNKIQEANPKTFKVINDKSYAKDDKNVFLDKEKIVTADPNTFEILDFPFARDKNDVYCGTLPMKLTANEVNEFTVTNEDRLMANTKSTTILSHFIELYPDYSWLKSYQVEHVITGPWGTGKTNTNKYKGFSVIK